MNTCFLVTTSSRGTASATAIPEIGMAGYFDVNGTSSTGGSPSAGAGMRVGSSTAVLDGDERVPEPASGVPPEAPTALSDAAALRLALAPDTTSAGAFTRCRTVLGENSSSARARGAVLPFRSSVERIRVARRGAGGSWRHPQPEPRRSAVEPARPRRRGGIARRGRAATTPVARHCSASCSSSPSGTTSRSRTSSAHSSCCPVNRSGQRCSRSPGRTRAPKSTCSCPRSSSSTPMRCSPRRPEPPLPTPHRRRSAAGLARAALPRRPRDRLGRERHVGHRHAPAREELPRRGVDQLVPQAAVPKGILTLAYMREQALPRQPQVDLPAGREDGFRAGRPRRRRTASRTSGPPTAAGTTSTTRRKARPARASRATSRTLRSGGRPTRSCSRPTRARSAASCSRRGEHDEGGAVPQPAGGVVDPVPEPRLDQPRRASATRPSSRSRWTTTTRRDGGTGSGRCSSGARSPIRPVGVRRGDAGHVHQRGHALVGRLADLRQRPGHPGPAAQRRRRQAADHRRRHACRSDQTAWKTPGSSATGGSGSGDAAHPLRARAQRDLRPPQAEGHPDWDDDRLFNVARLVNAAVMAKIHSIEWTPAILPNHGLDTGAQLELVRDAHVSIPQARSDRKTVAELQRRQPRARRPRRQPASTGTARRSV